MWNYVVTLCFEEYRLGKAEIWQDIANTMYSTYAEDEE